MNNKDKGRRGKPGQRHRKHFLENCRRKFSQSKERNVYQSKNRKKNIWDTKEPGLEKETPMSRINQSIKYTEQRKDYEI